jgi:pimeloyl-ACP methyl ester carboxylesterase
MITTREIIDQDRRRLLRTTIMGFAAVSAASLAPSQLIAAPASNAIRPFRVHVPDEQLADLRRRILATRWPDRETVSDQSQGAPLDKLQQLVRYWGSGYNWRKLEAKLNALPQFITTIDSVDIHFIHIRSKHPNALPVIVTHGWPGSIVEQLKIIDPLTNPTAHGGRAEDAFDVVIPSVPGYGFSGRPKETGWDPDRIARTWAALMKRLGHSRYVAQGGDWGTPISSAMARQNAEGLLGIHINLPATVPPEVAASLTGVWRDLYRAIRHRVLLGVGRWLLKLEFPTAPRLPCRSDNHAVGSIRLTPLASRAFREGRTVWPTYGQRG